MGEEGTGLGPSLEFYALVAAELQRKSLGIWLCSDEIPDDNSRSVRAAEQFVLLNSGYCAWLSGSCWQLGSYWQSGSCWLAESCWLAVRILLASCQDLTG